MKFVLYKKSEFWRNIVFYITPKLDEIIETNRVLKNYIWPSKR